MNQDQYKALQIRYNALVDAYQELDKKSRGCACGTQALPKPASKSILDLMEEICHRAEEGSLLLECVSGDKKSAKSAQYIYKVEKEHWRRVLADSRECCQPIYLQDKEEKDIEKMLAIFGLLEEGARGIYFKTTRNAKAIQVVKIKKEAYDLLLQIRTGGD